MKREEDNIPLSDAMDGAILMHRDAHFGGLFSVMLKYYREGGKGVCPDFEISRIEDLAAMELETKQNLAAVTLSGPQAEQIAASRMAYQKLRDLYESKKASSKMPLLIADLILSEEEQPEKEIEALVAEKEKAVPLLLELLKSVTFRDPLFPGYGFAPTHAAECLGRIGDTRAIKDLYQAMGEGDYFEEEIAADALRLIGKPARDFLLKILSGKPYNEDNWRAAIALSHFKGDPEIAEKAWGILSGLDLKKQEVFGSYLVFLCEALRGTPEAESFANLARAESTPKMLRRDIDAIVHGWSS